MRESEVTQPLRYGREGSRIMWSAMTRKLKPKLQPAFAAKLHSLRVDRGWSEEELEAKSGVARQTISRLERAETEPQAKTLKRLADVFGLRPSELLAVSKEVSEFETSDPSASMRLPPGLDVWLKARGYDYSDRIKDELKTAQIVFTKPPSKDTDWVSFYEKIAEALLSIKREPEPSAG